MYKLRNGAFQQSGEPIKVLTVPNDIAELFEETYFTVERSGTSIVFKSGTRIISGEEIAGYKFEDCRI